MIEDVVLPAPILACFIREGGTLPTHGNALGLLFGKVKLVTERPLRNTTSDPNTRGNSSAISESKLAIVTSFLRLDTKRFPSYGNLDVHSLTSFLTEHKQVASEVIGIYSIRPNTPLVPSVNEQTWVNRLPPYFQSATVPILLVSTTIIPSAVASNTTRAQLRPGVSFGHFVLENGRLRKVHTKVPSLPSTVPDYAALVSTGSGEATVAERKMFENGMKTSGLMVEKRLATVERLVVELKGLDKEYDVEGIDTR